MTAIQELLETLEEARQDIEDAYSAKTKVSATRARKAFLTVKKAAHAARGEVLAISKGEVDPVEVTLFPEPEVEEVDEDLTEAVEVE